MSINITDLIDRTGRPKSLDPHWNIVSLILFLVPSGIGLLVTAGTNNPVPFFIGALLGFILAQSPKIARQWEKGVVLRFGRYIGMKGPGLFWIFPFATQLRATPPAKQRAFIPDCRCT